MRDDNHNQPKLIKIQTYRHRQLVNLNLNMKLTFTIEMLIVRVESIITN